LPFVKKTGYTGVNVILGGMETMGNLLYILAVLLILAWLVGLVGFNLGGIIHILLVFAVVAILLRIIQGRRYR
jgi:hypothetical protein